MGGRERGRETEREQVKKRLSMLEKSVSYHFLIMLLVSLPEREGERVRDREREERERERERPSVYQVDIRCDSLCRHLVTLHLQVVDHDDVRILQEH